MTDPIRCFSCGKVLLWQKYNELVRRHDPKYAMDLLLYRKICCRRMFMSKCDDMTEACVSFVSDTIEFAEIKTGSKSFLSTN